MTLPLQTDGPQPGASPGASILIVDDRPDKLLALESVLEGLHQNLVKVRSGDEALRQLLSQDFAVILLDVNMPGLDGFETAALIRKRKRSETTPIIFISAINDTDNHVSRGYSLGAVDYILTPVIPEILRAKVAVFVELFLKTEQVKRQAEEHAQLLREQGARVQAEAERERMAFLAEASNVLGGSLDYEQTFASLARLVVPRLAEFCIIDRLDDKGAIQHIAVAHKDPGKLEELEKLYEVSPQGRRPMAHGVVRSGAPYVPETLDETVIGELFQGDALRSIQRLNPASLAVLPLVVRGQVVGCVTMMRTEKGSGFDMDDLWLADELARRTALALDNVELYSRANLARQEAETANHAKDRFLAMLSHELRTPLTPVMTHLFAFSSDPRIPDDLHKSLEVIRRNVELEARLIDDLLDLTRVSSGKIHVETKVIEIHELLRSALEICQPEVDAKGLLLNRDFSDSQIHVEADPARLQQVFWNIVKNAVKFTDKGGITVSTTRQGEDLVSITIQDTGIGIEPTMLSRIFLPFEQAECGTQGGLGLGLAITHALVDLHKGNIAVDSPGAGKGTTVIVTLPVAVAPPAAVPERETGSAEKGHGLRILLLEDHADSNAALTMLLEMRGYKVTSALTVASALEHAGQDDFDLLLSDLGLPDGSPGEVMKFVAERNGTIGVALSGLGMKKDFERSRSLGFSQHLVKPVDIGKLEEVLQECGRTRKPVSP